MVLRKPLAFLIRHFKLIHFLLVIVSIYLIYKTSAVLVFFNEYIGSNTSLAGSTLASTLITPYMYVALFVMMLGTALILTILKLKEKPIKFYIFNIFVCVIVLSFFLYDYTILERLEHGLVEIKVLELARDFLLISIILQNMSLIWLGIRATGFDIKSFHFNENLDELEIEETDNEEFEVDLDIDKHLYTRYFRKLKRFTTYMLKENKLLVTLGILIVIGISLYIVYLNQGVYEKTLKTNQAFDTNEFIINVENSYYTETDNRGFYLTEDTGFVVLRIKAKNKTIINRTLNIGRFALIVNNKFYYHTASYKEKLMDLGYSYASENIGTTFSSYILVFEVPRAFKDTDMVLKYADVNEKEIKIDVTPLDLTKERTKDSVSLQDELNFKDSILKNTILRIDEFAVSDKFKIDYKYCYAENSCYDSYEYVNATTSGNEKKSLLRLRGEVSIDDKISIEPITTVYKFMRYFATIRYTVNGIEYTIDSEVKRILPLKTENKNEYYIEVPGNMKNATSIEIIFNVRNYIYTYKLK